MILRASHDGYGRYGIIHQRAVMLTAGGNKLEGEDVFMPTHGEILPLARGMNSRCAFICIRR